MLDTLEVSFPFFLLPLHLTVMLATQGGGGGYFDIY